MKHPKLMSLLDQLLSRPDANILMDKAQSILASEQVRREQFYKDITRKTR